MKPFKTFISEGENKEMKGEDPCWSGYEMIGKKKKNDKEVPNCVPVKEEKDDVTEMIKDKLKIIINRAQEMHDNLQEGDDLPEWIKSKITLAQDYISTACDYSCGKEQLGEESQIDEVAAWQRKEGKSESGGLNRKGIESYRREHPGSKLSMAVTTEPSKLDPESKAAKRRKSFCARMSGMKKKLTSAETARDPDSRINKALRKWNC